MELYVIRHGQTIVNVKGLVNSINRIGLNKVGKNEARRARKELENVKIDLVFCSPLRRTKQTCRIINKRKNKVLYDKRIVERNSRSMQYAKVANLNLDEWYDLKKDVVYEDAEGFKSVTKRVGKFLEEIYSKYPDKSLLIVTHGDVCKAIYTYFDNVVDVKDIISFEQKNCEIRKYVLL